MLKKGIYFILIFFIFFLSISLLTFHPYDFPAITSDSLTKTENWFGKPGAFIASQLFTLFGKGTYLFIVFFILSYLSYSSKLFKKKRVKKLSGVLLAIFSVSFFIVMVTADQSFHGGGILAGLLDNLINRGFGIIGEFVFFIFLVQFSLSLISGKSFKELMSYFQTMYGKWIGYLAKNKKQDRAEGEKIVFHKPSFMEKVTYVYSEGELEKETEDHDTGNNFVYRQEQFVQENKATEENLPNESQLDVIYTPSNIIDEQEEVNEPQIDVIYDPVNAIEEKEEVNEPQIDVIDQSSNTIEEQQEIFVQNSRDNNCIELPFEGQYRNQNHDLKSMQINEIERTIENTVEIARFNLGLDKDFIYKEVIEKKNAEVAIEVVNMKVIPEINESKDDTELENNPEEEMIIVEEEPIAETQIETKLIAHDDVEKSFASLAVSNLDDKIIESDEEETIFKLEDTLKQFGIEAKVNHVSRGPVITRYEVQPAPGIKVSKIVSLQDNISLSLAASKIRIIAPIPGKSAVGIEIPNKHRDSVTLGDLLNSPEFKEQEYHLPIALGKGISGKTLVADLAAMPHLLIAGATGSGKSVFVNSLITSLLYSVTPKEVRFLMIDPKRVELKMYDEIPYLLAPVITEPKKAVVALKWAVQEMEERYKLLEKYSCRDMRSFNKKVMKMKKKGYATDAPFEYIVIIIDEFADLMMVCGKESEEYVSRLAAMSRAVGIHLVVATQRPSVDVITGLIKANFPARIAFQVSSKTESRIILDTNGADKLLGKGDLLFTAPGMDHMLRIQGAYLSDDEVNDFTSHLKSLSPPNYIDELKEIESEGDGNPNFSISDEPLFREAVEIILAERKASASYLQRKMRIGYNRAARIIELLEAEGIVGSQNGSKAREVLVESYSF